MVIVTQFSMYKLQHKYKVLSVLGMSSSKLRGHIITYNRQIKIQEAEGDSLKTTILSNIQTKIIHNNFEGKMNNFVGVHDKSSHTATSDFLNRMRLKIWKINICIVFPFHIKY